jgi:hypothetical protein
MNDYPTAKDLKSIKNWVPKTWNGEEFHVFMEYIRDKWKYADDGYWEQEGLVYTLHTAGWSGNESIIGAMMKNYIFWMLYWESNKRGGHYVFCPRKLREKNEE